MHGAVAVSIEDEGLCDDLLEGVDVNRLTEQYGVVVGCTTDSTWSDLLWVQAQLAKFAILT